MNNEYFYRRQQIFNFQLKYVPLPIGMIKFE